MARTIFFTRTLTANEPTTVITEVEQSPFNPLERTSRVKLYAKSSNASVGIGFQIGSDIHLLEGSSVPDDGGAGNPLSLENNLVAEAVGIAGQKIRVTEQNSAATTPNIQGAVVIEPLQ